MILASLEYTVHPWEHPVQHTGPGYGMGPYGYARLIYAVKAGAGDSHGNWWNATVWSECRSMAAAYFAEIADDLQEASTLSQDLSKRYSSIAEGLSRVSDKEMDATEKVALLETIREDELVCIGQVAQCAETIRPEAAALTWGGVGPTHPPDTTGRTASQPCSRTNDRRSHARIGSVFQGLRSGVERQGRRGVRRL
ncbi:MAG TPA: hypothetical protein QF604_09360 [Candidatus Latescibacteria bacterium]|nr:hypothetical protein [Candidatus Latescibacterota bacterium]